MKKLKKESNGLQPAPRNKSKKLFRVYNKKWVILITVWTFLLAASMSFISEMVLRNVDLLIAFSILIIIILIGILSDLVGIAVASARENPFHSMAANKIDGASFAVKLVKNAGPVSNFCNDVIGDICGIVSGAAGAIIILQFSRISGQNTPLFSVLISAFIASVTVGGKAISKEIALRQSTEIVFYVGEILSYIHHKTGLDFLGVQRKKKV